VIPESVLREILDKPVVAEILRGPNFSTVLARHITRESYREMQENAPGSAQLLAACTVLTNYVVNQERDLEVCSNFGQVYLGDERSGYGILDSSLSEALITMAEKVLRQDV